MAALIAKNSNNWNLIWRSVQQLDCDRNGFLDIEELEQAFREYFPFELNGKSFALYARKFGTDHNPNFVNYRRFKVDILEHRKSVIPDASQT